MTAYNNAVFMRACARIEWKWIVFYFFSPVMFQTVGILHTKKQGNVWSAVLFKKIET